MISAVYFGVPPKHRVLRGCRLEFHPSVDSAKIDDELGMVKQWGAKVLVAG